MSATLDQIYQSLNSSYQPQRDLVQQQLQQLPGQYDAQVQGLGAQKDIAFKQIDDQANSRGMLYSGAPTQEDHNYTQATYLPAVAQVRNQQNQAQYGLQSTLAQLGQQQQQQAYGQYNTGVQNDMQQNYLNQQIALAQQQAKMYSSMYGGGGGSAAASAPGVPNGYSQALQGIFSNFAQKNAMQPAGQKGYTERYIIPQLTKQFGTQYDPAQIQADVYKYRKALGFG